MNDMFIVYIIVCVNFYRYVHSNCLREWWKHAPKSANKCNSCGYSYQFASQPLSSFPLKQLILLLFMLILEIALENIIVCLLCIQLVFTCSLLGYYALALLRWILDLFDKMIVTSIIDLVSKTIFGLLGMSEQRYPLIASAIYVAAICSHLHLVIKLVDYIIYRYWLIQPVSIASIASMILPIFLVIVCNSYLDQVLDYLSEGCLHFQSVFLIKGLLYIEVKVFLKFVENFERKFGLFERVEQVLLKLKKKTGFSEHKQVLSQCLYPKILDCRR